MHCLSSGGRKWGFLTISHATLLFAFQTGSALVDAREHGTFSRYAGFRTAQSFRRAL